MSIDPSEILAKVVGPRVENPNLEEKLRKTVLTILFDHSQSTISKLPGPLPNAIHPHSLKLIQTKNYFVTAKLDGLRHMLLCTERGSYLIDRAFTFRKFTHSYIAEKHTLVDGEIIWKGEFKNNVQVLFVPFDICMYKGKKLSLLPFSQRLPYLNEFKKEMHSNESGFSIGSKLILPANQIEQIIQYIEFTPNWIYIEPNQYRSFCDGFVFMDPNGNFFFTEEEESQTKSHDPIPTTKLLKWKYDNTIDLCATFLQESNAIQLFYYTRTGINQQIGMISNPDPLVCKNLNPTMNVVEVSFPDYNDPSTWKMIKIRQDKKVPNHASVVEDTISVIKENISFETLISHILPGQRKRKQNPNLLEVKYNHSFLQIVKLLVEIVRQWKNTPNSELEGRIYYRENYNQKVSSGVTLELYQEIFKKCINQSKPRKQKSIDYAYGNVRKTQIFDEQDTMIHEEVVEKTMLQRLDIDLDQKPAKQKNWGIRIQLKTENQISLTSIPQFVRIKERLSFEHKEKKFSFDLTIVKSGTSLEKARCASPTYELEIEALRIEDFLKKKFHPLLLLLYYGN